MYRLMIKPRTIGEADEEAKVTYAAYLKEMKTLGFDESCTDSVNSRFRFYRTGAGTRFGFYAPFPEGPITRLDCINHVIEGALKAGAEARAEDVVHMIADKYDIDLRY